MTNLEWIRTLSAKELSDLLYDYWLPRGQYVWTDSRKGLIKVLGETYLERDCDKCKHQDNCYCVKGLGCPFEPKTEATISKMEQVEDEPQMGDAKPIPLSNRVTHIKDEPQIIKVGMATDSVTGKVLGVTLDTDCAWRKGE